MNPAQENIEGDVASGGFCVTCQSEFSNLQTHNADVSTVNISWEQETPSPWTSEVGQHKVSFIRLSTCLLNMY